MTLILPVVHHLNSELSLTQARLALEHGADGVFLISHQGLDQAVLQVAARLRHAWSQPVAATGELPFVGVNLLQTNNPGALEMAARLRLDGVWFDSPGVNSHGATPRTKKLVEDIQRYPDVTVFGSVAFKYQPDEPDPAGASREALKLGMLPTTSGDATGMAPELSKIQSMSAAVKGRLAVASGMNPENVSAYVPFVSHILVATGISHDEHTFDPARLDRFVAAVRTSGSVRA
ncbi:hypothetical protein [Ramlibacter sp. AN1133]|uniref:hypothetical protein n=1 Tax=Ramlibacter sp. AN1133 TaxID=3133429 RepID=UPI0030BAC9D6